MCINVPTSCLSARSAATFWLPIVPGNVLLTVRLARAAGNHLRSKRKRATEWKAPYVNLAEQQVRTRYPWSVTVSTSSYVWEHVSSYLRALSAATTSKCFGMLGAFVTMRQWCSLEDATTSLCSSVLQCTAWRITISLLVMLFCVRVFLYVSCVPRIANHECLQNFVQEPETMDSLSADDLEAADALFALATQAKGTNSKEHPQSTTSHGTSARSIVC